MSARAPAANTGLGSLIWPVSTQDFFQRYFECDVLHVARADGGHFTTLYGVGCVEDALVLGAGNLDRFRLVKHGVPALDPQDIASERHAFRSRSGRAVRSVIDPRKVLAAFADGYTLNIQDASLFHPPLARTCNEIQAEFGIYAQANAYFTPAGAQGFALHYDTHDTLIVQIDGAKDWQVYDPLLLLPLETQPFSPGTYEGRITTPRTIALEVGDSLYIPRGFAHEAATSERRSLHLTFTLSPLRVVDLLDALVRLAAHDDVALRRALPAGWQRDSGFAATLRNLLVEAVTFDRLAPATERARRQLFAAARTLSTGLFDALQALDTLHAASLIHLRTDAPFELCERGDRLDIVLAGSVVTIPATARAGFTLLQAGATTFARLGSVLPPGSDTAFVRELVIRGLVRIDDSSGTDGHYAPR